MIKRFVDIIFASICLFVLLPLFFVVAIAIKLDSPGPVFFRQTRVGRYGRPFRIHKFRTMVSNAESLGSQLTVSGDSRITFIGSLLRKSKIDELPQLIDVLFGKMSFVGPRPEVPHYVSMYPSDLRDLVLSVRPGITDPASLRFRDEASFLESEMDPEAFYVSSILPRKLVISCDYIKVSNVWSDFGCVLATVARVMLGSLNRNFV